MPKRDPNAPNSLIQVTREIPDDEIPSFDYDADATDSDESLGFYSLDEAHDEINVLYYGREGTGKTTDLAMMANTAPEGSRVLIINAEAGTKKAALQRRGVDTSKIVMWPPKGQRVTFAGLVGLHRRLLSDLSTDPNSWAGVGMDSVTEITAALREQATESRQEKLDRLGRQHDENLVDIADYGVMTDQLRRVIRRFRDLPCHFVATALERTDDTTKTVGPDVTPALASALMGYVDFVLYCRADVEVAGEAEDEHGAEFRALTRANSKYRAKDRFDATPKVLANPTFDRLVAYVEGDLTEATDALQQGYNERQTERDEAKAAALAAKAAARQDRKVGTKRG